MNVRTVLSAVGAALTTFLLVGAVTIELLGGGEAPAVGIIGVFVGLVAALLAGVLVSAAGDRPSGPTASAIIGYASFGLTFIAIAGLQYVNVPGADDVFTFPVHVGVSVVASVVAALLAERGYLPERPSDA